MGLIETATGFKRYESLEPQYESGVVSVGYKILNLKGDEVLGIKQEMFSSSEGAEEAIRNKKWVGEIVGMLAMSSGASFVAVGSFLLFSEDGEQRDMGKFFVGTGFALLRISVEGFGVAKGHQAILNSLR